MWESQGRRTAGVYLSSLSENLLKFSPPRLCVTTLASFLRWEGCSVTLQNSTCDVFDDYYVAYCQGRKGRNNLQQGTPKDTDALRKHIIMNVRDIPHAKCRLKGKLNTNPTD